MKYFSDITRKFYETEQDCINAEVEVQKAQEAAQAERQKKIETRKQRADEVEAARHYYLEARKTYNEVLTQFCRDYGAYHCSIKDNQKENVADYLDALFGLF